MTTTQIKLTGDLITETLVDGLYGWAGDTRRVDKFVDLALAEYRNIIEDVTGGTWASSYSEVYINVDTDLPEGWEDTILDRIGDVDLVSIHQKVEGTS